MKQEQQEIENARFLNSITCSKDTPPHHTEGQYVLDTQKEDIRYGGIKLYIKEEKEKNYPSRGKRN